MVLGTRRKEVALRDGHIRSSGRKGLVRVVGLEPTLLAETDFESVASTIPPHPPDQAPLVAISTLIEGTRMLAPSLHGRGLPLPAGGVNGQKAAATDLLRRRYCTR